jgi:hypothetical protein
MSGAVWAVRWTCTAAWAAPGTNAPPATAPSVTAPHRTAPHRTAPDHGAAGEPGTQVLMLLGHAHARGQLVGYSHYEECP